MTLVSLDAIVQADATLIVGVVFLVALKRAWLGEKERLSSSDRIFVLAAMLCYISSAFVGVLPDIASSFGLAFGMTPTAAIATKAMGLSMLVSFGLFYLGMAMTAGAVYSITRTAIS